MALESVGPGGVSNSYGVRVSTQPVNINSAKPKDVYNEYAAGPAPYYSLDSSGNVTGLVGPDGSLSNIAPIVVRSVGLQNPGVFVVTGTTDAQTVDIADLTGLLGVGDTVEVHAIWSYTASTNAKTLGLVLDNTLLISTARNVSTETGTKTLYRFSVSSPSGVLRETSMIIGQTSTAFGAETAVNWNAMLKARITLASGAEEAQLRGYTVIIYKAK
jgi:hypothetical protein